MLCTILNPQLLPEENRSQSKSVSCTLNLVSKQQNSRADTVAPEYLFAKQVFEAYINLSNGLASQQNPGEQVPNVSTGTAVASSIAWWLVTQRMRGEMLVHEQL